MHEMHLSVKPAQADLCLAWLISRQVHSSYSSSARVTDMCCVMQAYTKVSTHAQKIVADSSTFHLLQTSSRVIKVEVLSEDDEKEPAPADIGPSDNNNESQPIDEEPAPPKTDNRKRKASPVMQDNLDQADEVVAAKQAKKLKTEGV